MTGVLISLAVSLYQGAPRSPKVFDPLSSSKQIAVSVMIYLSDHDDKFPAMKGWKKALMPYIKNENLFHPEGVPYDKESSFSLNAKIAGKKATSVKDPSKTVLLYMGKNGKFTFNKNGKTVVSFADTSTKWLSKAEVKSLTWNP